MYPVISFSLHPQGCWVGRVWAGGLVFLLARSTLTPKLGWGWKWGGEGEEIGAFRLKWRVSPRDTGCAAPATPISARGATRSASCHHPTPLLLPALQVAEAPAPLAEVAGLARRSFPRSPDGPAAPPPLPATRLLTALCRPRCPCAAAAAGGVGGGDHEAQPEEDAAHWGEEGAPGRGLPGRGGRHGLLQGLI